MASTEVNTFVAPPRRMIYAYTMPGVTYLEGWIKIGQTGCDAQERIAGQTFTSGIKTRLEWQDYAMYKDGSGELFTDKNFHYYLIKQGIRQYVGDECKPREIFNVSPEESQKHFANFASHEMSVNEEIENYTLRAEQQDAVAKTKVCFESDAEKQEFLWNAKPRFGKTLTAYSLVMEMGFKSVLVVSNRPSVSNSWAEDFYKFLSGKKEYSFVTDNDALKANRNAPDAPSFKKCIQTSKEFLACRDAPKKIIVFESLQGLKGSIYFGGEHDKLKWLSGQEFDLLIVDESHEGVDTLKTEQAFDNIKRKHTLYLSGTPFKQLAGPDFGEEQIFNWSYADEQEAKACWQGAGINPYEHLPKLSLFTYQMSEIVRDKAQRGMVLAGGGDAVEYAFDLNEFFRVNDNGHFVHEKEVRKFVAALGSQEKYPFSTPELRKALAHTMWYLNRVDSAKALKKILAEDEVFTGYKVILAVGDARDEKQPGLKAYDQVKAAIAENDKTITLTVGQLTVGITIPQWSAVLMLCNMSSPSAYMQAAFRAQNPCYELRGDELLQKDAAFVFDFDPARTLVVLEEFAVNLDRGAAGGKRAQATREEKIKRLLNFLPVIGEDESGKMVELDAAQVLSIPRKLKSREVVNCGFMSNFLFQNIGNIFAAPKAVRDILAKIPLAGGEKGKAASEKLDNINNVPVDEHGDVNVPQEKVIGLARDILGEKIYEITVKAKAEAGRQAQSGDDYAQKAKNIASQTKNLLEEQIVAPIAKNMGVGKKEQRKIVKKASAEIDREFDKIAAKSRREEKIARAVYERELEQAANEKDKQVAQKKRDESLAKINDAFTARVEETSRKMLEEKPVSVVREIETAKTIEIKQGIEAEARKRLNGFSRAIPSFIMVYGDENLRLANFESYVSPGVFQEVTGISLEEFIFLRDGGDYQDEATGRTEHFAGQLFDDVVFNDSIQEFLRKKEELADYFSENQKEDIFDYIPPQKTNQIFTPRRIVELMVDMLEKENPGCFDDKNKTFADLYMKSGLYIAEIIKRLFRSQGMIKDFPEERERIRHILEKQVYGMAPTEIIYRIAINFILGFRGGNGRIRHNFIQADSMAAARNGTLQELVNKSFTK